MNERSILSNGKCRSQFFNNVRVTTGETQHNPVVDDVDKKQKENTLEARRQ